MKNIRQLIMLTTSGLGMAALVGCANMPTSTESLDTISQAPFGKTPDGTPVEIYTLRNARGAEARIMTYGGIVQSLKMPDQNGNFADIVLGFDKLEGYTSDSYVKGCPYFGALIGRYGNRIGGAKFTLEGQTYTLSANDHGNTLHGGIKGFDKVVWTPVKANIGPEGPRLELNYLSKDGEEGFPGNLNVTATYTLTDDNGLK
ncbi:MAG: galactose-1-epimerase, partial [Verrucomicrobiia bacterium]